MLMRHGSEEPTKIPTALSESTCLRVVTLDKVSDDEMQDIENKLNNRPTKLLGFKTPMQAFYNIN